MPFAIPNTTTQDAYVPALTFAGTDVLSSGYFTVANASVYCRLLHGQVGQARPGPEIFLPPGTYPVQGTARDPIAGVQFRSAVAGTPAQVFGSFFYPNEASIQAGTPFDSTVSATGGVSGATGLLGKATRTTNFATAGAVAEAAPTTILALGALDIPNPPVEILFEVDLGNWNVAAFQQAGINIWDMTSGVDMGRIALFAAGAAGNIPGTFRRSITPGASGSRVFAARGWGSAAFNILAAAPDAPFVLRAYSDT